MNPLYKLVSSTKEWKAERKAAILPTLLQENLVDHYVDLDTETEKDLQLL